MKLGDLKREAVLALESLPAEIRSQLHNLVVVVEDRPTRSQLRGLGLDPGTETLYGLYEGTPLSERSSFDLPSFPDKITLFAGSLVEDFEDPEELREQVRITALHEIAHHFGMEEDELDELGY